MKAIVVISLDLPSADDMADVMEHLDPPKIPHFDRQVRIAVEPVATQVVAWLDGDPPDA